MALLNRVKLDTEFVNSTWDEQDRTWETIEGIDKILLQYDIVRITTNTKLLSSPLPTFTKINIPTVVAQELTNSVTNMSEI